MRVPRVYCGEPLRPRKTVVVAGQAAARLARVLRLREGAAVVVFDGRGLQCDAVVGDIKRRTVELRLGACAAHSVESPLTITLAAALCRAEKMDYLLQKAVELGVAEFAPTQTRRSVARADEKRAAQKLAHWHGIVINACEQCGRNGLPRLRPPRPLADVIAAATYEAQGRHCFYLGPRAEARLRDTDPLDKITLFTGPEGGFTEDEITAMAAAGCKGLRLGPRTLRAETAAIAAVAAINSMWGDS